MTQPSSPPPGPRLDGFAEALGSVGAAVDAMLARGPVADDAYLHREGWEPLLAGPLPEHGSGADDVLAALRDVVVPHGTRLADPGFWGWITTAPSTAPVVAQAAASVLGGQRYTLTAYNLLEAQSLVWLADLCGLPPGMRGVYSSGGSVANLLALGAARQWCYERRGLDPSRDGTGGLATAVYASEEVHHTVGRSAAVLGLGRRSLRLVPTDDRLRLRPDALAEAMAADAAAGIVPLAVVASAGTTNAGAIDPLREIGAIARDHGAWFHVDGAYGLPGVLDDRVADRYDGLALADSVIVDPHKWLNAPVGVGATFVRDPALLHRAFTQEPAEYLESFAGDPDDPPQVSLDSMGEPYADMSVELSSPSRGVMVWAILRELGRDGVAARVRADNDLARRLAAIAREHPRLELLLEPELSIVCFRYASDSARDLDAVNEAVLRRLHRETPYLPSSTRVHGTVALRPCFINPRTTPDLVDGLAAAVVRLGDELVAAGG